MAGHRSAQEDQVLLGIEIHYLKILSRDAFNAVVTGHLLVRKHTPGRLPLSDRSGMPPLLVGAVRLPKPGKAPALYHSLEAAALGRPGDLRALDFGNKLRPSRIAGVYRPPSLRW